MKSSTNIPHKQHDSKEEKNNYQREWRKRNPEKCQKYNDTRDREKIREGAWNRRYGITREDYDSTLLLQDNSCAICKTREIGRGHEYFHVDHNHKTGGVRGLLCDKCNRGLGYFNDDPYTLDSASNYLREYNES